MKFAVVGAVGAPRVLHRQEKVDLPDVGEDTRLPSLTVITSDNSVLPNLSRLGAGRRLSASTIRNEEAGALSLHVAARRSGRRHQNRCRDAGVRADAWRDAVRPSVFPFSLT